MEDFWLSIREVHEKCSVHPTTELSFISLHEIRSAARLVQSANEYGISRFRPSALVIQLQGGGKDGTWASLFMAQFPTLLTNRTQGVDEYQTDVDEERAKLNLPKIPETRCCYYDS